MAASDSRFFGGAAVTSSSSSCVVAAVTAATARLNAASLAFEGFVEPLILRTYCSAASWASSRDAGGSKLWRVLMFRHMTTTLYPKEMTTSEQSLNSVALSATVHCLTGCAIGEVLGMIIGTALGFSDLGTIVLAVVLAFFFGYSLTSLPLLRSGLALAAVVPIAFASDTISIAIMEIVDNAIMLLIPGAMDAGLDDIGFYAALAAALIIAGAAAYPVNRRLISRGKGHAVVHQHHAHQ